MKWRLRSHLRLNCPWVFSWSFIHGIFPLHPRLFLFLYPSHPGLLIIPRCPLLLGPSLLLLSFWALWLQRLLKHRLHIFILFLHSFGRGWRNMHCCGSHWEVWHWHWDEHLVVLRGSHRRQHESRRLVVELLSTCRLVAFVVEPVSSHIWNNPSTSELLLPRLHGCD